MRVLNMSLAATLGLLAAVGGAHAAVVDLKLARATTLGSTGWVEGVEYEFSFDLGPSNLVVSVGGVQQFNLAATRVTLSALEFMQRLAVLVPRPRLHLIRFHGVLAPNAKLRALVLQQEAAAPAQAAPPAECEAGCAHHRPVRLSWAKLLKRVFDLDLEHRPNCGGVFRRLGA